MVILKSLLAVFFIFFSLGLFSQVEINGDLRLGDTTQTHVIHTKNGDRLVGRVVGFDEKNLQFLMLGNRLTFPLADVKNITVKTASGEMPKTGPTARDSSSVPTFRYDVKLATGSEVQAEFLGYQKGKIYFGLSGANKLVKKPEELISIQLVGEPSDEPIEQRQEIHYLTPSKRQPQKGQLLSFQNDQWSFSNQQGKVLNYDRSEVQEIEVTKNDKSLLNAVPEAAVSQKYPDFPIRRFTRTFVAPTAFMLKKGESEYRNTEILYNNLEHGLSDFITAGGSFSSLLQVHGVGIKAKAGTSISPVLNVAGGGQIFYIFESISDAELLTNYFAVMTLGTLENHLSLSVGRISGIDSDPSANVSIAASIRTGRKSRIFIEYNRLNEVDEDGSFSIANLGMTRFKDRNRVDFGFTLLGDGDELVPFPIAAYSYYF